MGSRDKQYNAIELFNYIIVITYLAKTETTLCVVYITLSELINNILVDSKLKM